MYSKAIQLYVACNYSALHRWWGWRTTPGGAVPRVSARMGPTVRPAFGWPWSTLRLEAEEKLSLPSEKAQLGGQAGRLTGHFHGEEDDSNLGGMLRKCPSKEGFFEMPPELHWKRRNVEGGEKGSPMQRMASLKTKV